MQRSSFTASTEEPAKADGLLQVRFQKLLARSNGLAYTLPTTDNTLKGFCGDRPDLQAEAALHASETRPFIHQRALQLAERFLAHKKAHGSRRERQLYDGLTIDGFLQRLLTMRPLTFTTAQDQYLLRDGVTKGAGGFEHIGSEGEAVGLTLDEYLSYEEMEVAALLGVSGPTHFVHSGGFMGRGVAADPESFESKGHFVGMVGARLDKPGVMEWKHMVVTRDQNTAERGYGQSPTNGDAMLSAWAQFYGLDGFPSYAEADADVQAGGCRFVRSSCVDGYLDTKVYQTRCELLAETFLVEADERAAKSEAMAFCHIAALGLDGWQVDSVQRSIQADAYGAVVRRLPLTNIGALRFCGFEDLASCAGVCSGAGLTSAGGCQIPVMFGDRNPADRLPLPPFDASPWILMAQYPWNSNSYPGNAYWLGGQLTTSSSSAAAAACSMIPELHNPQVNIEAFRAIRVHAVPALPTLDASLGSLVSIAPPPPADENRNRPSTAPSRPSKVLSPSSEMQAWELRQSLVGKGGTEGASSLGGENGVDGNRSSRPSTAPTNTRPKRSIDARTSISDGLLRVGGAVWPIESTRLPPWERLHRDYVAKRHLLAFQDMNHSEVTLECVREVARCPDNEVFSHCPPTLAAPPVAATPSYAWGTSIDAIVDGLPDGGSSPFKIRRYEGLSVGRPYNWILGTIIWSPSSSSSAPAPPFGSADAFARTEDDEEVIVKAFPSGEDKAITLVEYLSRCRMLHKAAGLEEEAAQLISSLSDPLRRPFRTRAELEHQRDILEAMVMNEELDFSFSAKGVRVTLDRLPKAIVLAALDNIGVTPYTAAAAKWRALQERALRIDEAFYGPDHVEIAKLLTCLGHVYAALGETHRQRDALVRALRIQKAFYGLDHAENAQLLVCLANAYGKLGDAAKQRSLLDLAFRIQEDTGGNAMEVAVTLTSLGDVQGAVGETVKQRNTLLKALECMQVAYGSDHMEVVVVLTRLAGAYGTLGCVHEQQEAAQRAVDIFEAFYGDDHVEVARPLVCLANALGVLGHPVRWRDLNERALELVRDFYGPSHQEVAYVLAELGNACGVCGDAARKKELLSQTISIQQAVYGQRHAEVAKTMVNLADAYGDCGDPVKKRDILKMAIVLLEESHGADHIEVAKALASLGAAMGALGDPLEHRRLSERALHMYEAFYGPDYVKVADVLVNLATAYGSLGDATKAKALAERAVAIQEDFYGTRDYVEVAPSLVQLASALGSLGDCSKEVELLEKALAVQEAFYGPSHVEVASTLCKLGCARGQLGDAALQKSLLERALVIQEEYFGPDHVEVALTLTGLSNAHGAFGDVPLQRSLLERALQIQEDFYGQDHVEVATTMTFLASAYGKLGDPDAKKDLLVQALRVFELFYGGDHVEVSKLLTSLGNAYGSLGQIEQKRDVLVRSLGIKEAYYGLDHVEVAITLINLANAHGVLGELDRQRELLERALLINTAFYGPDHVKVARCRFNLAHCFEHLGEAEAAIQEMEAAHTVFEKQLGATHEHTASAAHWLQVLQDRWRQFARSAMLPAVDGTPVDAAGWQNERRQSTASAASFASGVRQKVGGEAGASAAQAHRGSETNGIRGLPANMRASSGSVGSHATDGRRASAGSGATFETSASRPSGHSVITEVAPRADRQHYDNDDDEVRSVERARVAAAAATEARASHTDARVVAADVVGCNDVPAVMVI